MGHFFYARERGREGEREGESHRILRLISQGGGRVALTICRVLLLYNVHMYDCTMYMHRLLITHGMAIAMMYHRGIIKWGRLFYHCGHIFRQPPTLKLLTWKINVYNLILTTFLAIWTSETFWKEVQIRNNVVKCQMLNVKKMGSSNHTLNRSLYKNTVPNMEILLLLYQKKGIAYNA